MKTQHAPYLLNVLFIDVSIWYTRRKDALTMKQQRNVITEYCFVRPIYLFLNQMNSCDTWLARFDWHQPHTSYFKSAYHILDLVFWFGLSILTKIIIL